MIQTTHPLSFLRVALLSYSILLQTIPTNSPEKVSLNYRNQNTKVTLSVFYSLR